MEEITNNKASNSVSVNTKKYIGEQVCCHDVINCLLLDPLLLFLSIVIFENSYYFEFISATMGNAKFTVCDLIALPATRVDELDFLLTPQQAACCVKCVHQPTSRHYSQLTAPL